tara:strand:+ start:187 stop:789 length:603 start_codon:yes stop_codon:yes gene_type:complete
MNTKTKNYWKNLYYSDVELPTNHSSFAEFVYSYLSEKQTLVDIGCGNGRDTAFFEKKYDRVYGYDYVSNPNYLGNKNRLIIEDVEDFDVYYAQIYYMRFFAHAIDEDVFDNLLEKISFNKDCKICIETRSSKEYTNDPKLITNFDSVIGSAHYRILYSKDYLERKISNRFKIDYIVEDKNLAHYLNDNPYIIRIIASTKS